MKKSLLFVLIAVLTAFLIFTGCPTGNDTSSDNQEQTDNGNNGNNNGAPPPPVSTPPTAVQPDATYDPDKPEEVAKYVKKVQDQLDAAADGSNKQVALQLPAGAEELVVNLASALTIPEGVELIVPTGVYLDLSAAADGKAVIIEGAVTVEKGGTLITKNGYDYYGDDGEIVLEKGSGAIMVSDNGAGGTVSVNYVGTGSNPPHMYQWDSKVSDTGKLVLKENDIALESGTLHVKGLLLGTADPIAVISAGTTITISEGTTLKIAPDCRFTIDEEKDGKTAAQIVLNGTIEVESGACFKLHSSFRTTFTEVGKNGKVRFNYGSILHYYGPDAGGGLSLIGQFSDASNAIFNWVDTDTSAYIELGGMGDEDQDSMSEYTIHGKVELKQGYEIFGTDTIVLARDAELTLTAKLTGKSGATLKVEEGGAVIKGSGTTFNDGVITNGRISAGTYTYSSDKWVSS
jgi:hypothetical protein